MSNHLIPGHDHPVSEFFARSYFAPRQYHKTLTLWPIVLRGDVARDDEPPYVTLSDAMESGAVRVDEVDQGGSVPHVRVTNDGEQPVLFLFGEEIVGAKQNRVPNATFLVPGKSETVIDVSCIESGRWSRSDRRGFASPGECLSSEMRRRMADQVTKSRRRGGRFDADQGEVWGEIDARIACMARESPTRSYSEYRQSRQREMKETLKGFRPLDNQVGFVAAVGDEITGLEVIGQPRVFARQFGALIRSYLIDAIDAASLGLAATPRPEASRFEAPDPFVQALIEAPARCGPSLGLGEDLRIEREGVVGCALVHGDLVHLTAFPAPERPA